MSTGGRFFPAPALNPVITHNKHASQPVPREALTRRVAVRSGASDETVTSVITALLGVVEEILLAGERVELGDLLDLGVIQEPARIRKEPSGRFAEIAPARRRLDVQIGEPIRERLEQQRTAAVLLVMPPKGMFTGLLRDHFKKLGWDVEAVGTSEEVLAKIDGPQPYLVVLDHALPERDALVATLKTDWRTNAIPVVTLHTRAEDLGEPEALFVFGDLQATEPINIHPFLRTVDQVLASSTEQAAVFERQIRFRFPAREDEILRGFDLADGFFRDSGFRGDSLVALTTAFREAVRNAELHGCQENPKQCIEVEILLDPKNLTVSVEDPGDGFDHRAFREGLQDQAAVSMARHRHSSGRMGGLGIYLMERCADRLEYSDSGNRVTLTKKREESGGDETRAV